MSEEWQKYVEDPRQACKYGAKCYQKNPVHRKTYKHPPNLPNEKIVERFKPYKKRRKITHEFMDQKNEGNEQKKGETSTSSEEAIGNKSNTQSAKDVETGYVPSNPIPALPEDISFFNESTDNIVLKDLFLVEMPNDFFKFYDLLGDSVSAKEKTLASVNLEMIGPYDLLTGKLPKLDDKSLYLIHWRFFFDPPEFQAVLKKKGKSEFHIGYFRDSPDEEPVFVASNDSSKDCHITPMSTNLFGAVYHYLQKEKKTSLFVSTACDRLSEKIKQAAKEHGYPLEEYNIKKRWSKAVTKTFHGAGIVVKVNKTNQVGYRHLIEKDAKIKELFTKLQNAKSDTERDNVLSELQPIITYASIAVDECDFGTGLELGIDLFCSGLKVLEKNALHALSSAYSLLNRDAFVKIIETHMKYRRKGPNMSILSQ